MKIKQKYLLALWALLSFLVSSLSYAQEETKKGVFKNESEAGVVITGGNSSVSTISLKQLNSYGWDKNTGKFTAGYLRSSTSGVETAYRWNTGLRYERALSDNYSLFLGQGVESDKFQDILQRYLTDAGAKYLILKEDSLDWFVEAGYRFQHDNYSTYAKNFSYGRLYTEAKKSFNKSVSTKLWLEYLPNLTVTQKYQINTELSLSAVLSEIFSFKAGYLIRFDNQPVTGVVYKTDSTFTTALVAKY